MRCAPIRKTYETECRERWSEESAPAPLPVVTKSAACGYITCVTASRKKAGAAAAARRQAHFPAGAGGGHDPRLDQGRARSDLGANVRSFCRARHQHQTLGAVAPAQQMAAELQKKRCTPANKRVKTCSGHERIGESGKPSSMPGIWCFWTRPGAAPA